MNHKVYLSYLPKCRNPPYLLNEGLSARWRNSSGISSGNGRMQGLRRPGREASSGVGHRHCLRRRSLAHARSLSSSPCHHPDRPAPCAGIQPRLPGNTVKPGDRPLSAAFCQTFRSWRRACFRRSTSPHGKPVNRGYSTSFLTWNNRRVTRTAGSVFRRHEVLRQLPVVQQTPWRGHGDTVVPVLIPTRYAWVRPDHVAALFVHQLVVAIMHVSAYLKRSIAVLDHLAERLGDVAHLTLGVKNDTAAMGKIGVRAIGQEQVGKARHCDAKIAPGVIIAPDAANAPPAASLDVHRPQHLGRL